jgi:hypothetical protein
VEQAAGARPHFDPTLTFTFFTLERVFNRKHEHRSIFHPAVRMSFSQTNYHPEAYS